jgi:hypothetical protein
MIGRTDGHVPKAKADACRQQEPQLFPSRRLLSAGELNIREQKVGGCSKADARRDTSPRNPVLTVRVFSLRVQSLHDYSKAIAVTGRGDPYVCFLLSYERHLYIYIYI